MRFELNRSHGYAHIKRMEREGSVGELLEALGVPPLRKSANLRSAVVNALARVGDAQAVPAICELLLSDSAEPVRRTAARALGGFEDPQALPALRSALDDESERVQLWAVQSIGRLRDRESVDRLIGMLESPDWGFRSYAASALGEIGDQRATEPLIRRIQDQNGTVQLAVISALRKLGDSRAVGPLREAREAAGWWRRRRLDQVLSDLEARGW